jgi:hypothetical protein
VSKKKLEAAKLAIKKAKTALEKLKKANKTKPKISPALPKRRPKPKVLPKSQPKPKPRKTKAPIELRGGAKTNPNNPRATRKIAQVAQNPNLRGKEKTLAIQEAIRGVRSPTRKRGSSKPEVGLAFKEMFRKKRKKPRKKKRGK